MIPVSSEGLCGRTVAFGDDELERADVLPFFDDAGEVQLLVILTADGQIRGLSPIEYRVRTPWFGAISIDAELIELRQPELEALDSLWHFDSAWRLNRPEFSRHPLRGWIKQTNCVERFVQGDVTETLFRRNLKRISQVVRGKKGSNGVVAFKPTHLPGTPKQDKERQSPAALPPTSGWRLKPIWEPVCR